MNLKITEKVGWRKLQRKTNQCKAAQWLEKLAATQAVA